MKIRSLMKFDSPAEMSLAVLGSFVSYMLEVLAVKRSAAVAISGGTSPLGFYTLLAKPGNEQLLPWDRIHLFWADERFVPQESPESNFGSARETFLHHLPIPEENLHPIRTNRVDPEAAAAGYRKDLRKFFGSGIPVFDLITLGMGPDGHIASLFPNSPALKENALPAVAAPPPRLVKPKVPRVSLTFPVLNRAGRVMLITSGEEKQHIIEYATSPDTNKIKYPVQLLDNENLHWFLSMI